MGDAAERSCRRLWPRSRRAKSVVCAVPLIAVLVGATWFRSRPDPVTGERIAVLKGDPLLRALRAQLGPPAHPFTRWTCTMELPPSYAEEFRAPADEETVQQLAATARRADWTATVIPQPDRDYTVELHKSFGAWASDSLMMLHQRRLTVELDTADEQHTPC